MMLNRLPVLAKQNILLFGQRQSSLEAVAAVLADLEHNIHVFTTVEELLIALDVEDFAVVVIDAPQADDACLEIATRIHESNRSREIPIVALIEQLSEETNPWSERAAELVHGVYKPLGPAVIRARVRTLLRIARKEALLRARSNELEVILDHLADGVVVAERDGRLVLVNSAANRIVGPGIHADSVEKLPSKVGIFHSDGVTPMLPDDLALSRALRGEERCDTEMVVRNFDHPQGVTVSVVGRSIRSVTGEIVGAVAVLRDVTELRRLNHELREQAERLEQARLRAEQESQYKTRFLAGMSHELRTPLNAIIGFSELLEQELYGALNERQKQYVRNVLGSGRHLLNLVTDILDLSKIEAGRMELRRSWVRLEVIVDEALGVAQSLADRRGVSLACFIGGEIPELYVDPLRMRQVLLNLLSNAVKFTPRGGLVTLLARSDGTQVSLEVADTGIGISEKNQEQLFREFTRFENSGDVDSEGTGLGLALTRRLVDMHGGQISVRSQLGKGSTFTVSLPVLGCLRRAPGPAWTPGYRDLTRVLVVEDDPITCLTLEMQLRTLGLFVAVAADAAAALRLARELRPGVILLDINLPDADGWTVLGQLRSEPTTAAISVIMVSVMAEPARSEQLGASGYLVKPVSTGSLQAALNTVGMHICSIEGRRILILGSNSAYLTTIIEHLSNSGCIVQRRESDQDERTAAAVADLVIVDGTSVRPSALAKGAAAGPAAASAPAHLLLIDRKEDSAGFADSGWRTIPLADALDQSHLVRVVYSTVRQHARKGTRTST